MSTLYTFGYLSPKGERSIKELVTLGVPLVDIRYKANSRRWQYGGTVLKQRLGDLYYHIPELGNEWYKEALTGAWKEPHIKLSDPEVGLARLKLILDANGRAAIFCACSSNKTCHRRLVAEMARERFSLTVIHL